MRILIASIFALFIISCEPVSEIPEVVDLNIEPLIGTVLVETKRPDHLRTDQVPVDEYLFNFISAGENFIYTFDQHSEQLIGFSSEFEKMVTGGASGRGPGEFDLEMSPVGHATCPDGSLLAHDLNKPELIRFSSNLEIIEVLELQEPAYKVLCMDDDTFVYLTRFSNTFVVSSFDGTVKNTFSIDKSFGNPYSAMKLVARSDDSLFITYPVKDRLLKVDFEGNIMQQVRYPVVAENPDAPITVTTRSIAVSESRIAIIVNTEDLPIINVFDKELNYLWSFSLDYLVNDMIMLNDQTWLLITHGNRSMRMIEVEV